MDTQSRIRTTLQTFLTAAVLACVATTANAEQSGSAQTDTTGVQSTTVTADSSITTTIDNMSTLQKEAFANTLVSATNNVEAAIGDTTPDDTVDVQASSDDETDYSARNLTISQSDMDLVNANSTTGSDILTIGAQSLSELNSSLANLQTEEAAFEESPGSYSDPGALYGALENTKRAYTAATEDVQAASTKDIEVTDTGSTDYDPSSGTLYVSQNDFDQINANSTTGSDVFTIGRNSYEQLAAILQALNDEATTLGDSMSEH